MTTLIDLIGIHDNLDEAPDFFNHPQNILGVVISFMVRQFLGHEHILSLLWLP